MKDENKAITEEQLGGVSGGWEFSPTDCFFQPAVNYYTGAIQTKTVGEGTDAVMWAKCGATTVCQVCRCKGVACIDNWHKQYGCSKY
ncbi:MAG: hypothetical protein FWG87_10525 [Defluviitaleaceae bacterium]|nr:hypothetical protein [Defluviitaleaceae bacterium]